MRAWRVRHSARACLFLVRVLISACVCVIVRAYVPWCGRMLHICVRVRHCAYVRHSACRVHAECVCSARITRNVCKREHTQSSHSYNSRSLCFMHAHTHTHTHTNITDRPYFHTIITSSTLPVRYLTPPPTHTTQHIHQHNIHTYTHHHPYLREAARGQRGGEHSHPSPFCSLCVCVCVCMCVCVCVCACARSYMCECDLFW